jgi:two-component system sensor histidine kinase/response regulator
MTNGSQETPRPRPRLLVAEDNPVNQKVALAMVARLGYTADVVPNGAEAVDRLAQNEYVAVLMDCQMPEMDGYEATVAIREREHAQESSRTPIIAMTAAAMAGDRQRCLDAGMDDYLSKPVKLAELHATLQRWTVESPAISLPQPPDGEVGDLGSGPIDPARIAELRELSDKSNRDGFWVLADSFLEDSPPRLAAIQQAVGKRDASAIAWEAHALKGAAANIGATKLSDICRQIEVIGASNDLVSADELLAELQAEFQRVEEALVEETRAGSELLAEHVDRQKETIHF